MRSTDDEPWLDLASVKQSAKKALLEKQIEERVCKRAERHGWRSLKFVSPNYRSVPDRIFFKHPARVFFIEFKKRGEVPTPNKRQK
jgi:hypothetical protein